MHVGKRLNSSHSEYTSQIHSILASTLISNKVTFGAHAETCRKYHGKKQQCLKRHNTMLIFWEGRIRWGSK